MKLKSFFTKAKYPIDGPRIWPWWKIMSLKIVTRPTCYRLWMYTRWGSFALDFVKEA